MTVTLLRGDAAHLPIADQSVDLIVTSPPYFALRSYQDGGKHYPGQIGSEATPGEWVDALVACTREWVRVLKPSGSMFVNLGDKYSTGASGQSDMAKLGERYRGGGHKDAKAKTKTLPVPGFQPKSLLGLPWRYALRCIDELGLILRAEIVWSKPNGLPESVTDRVRRSHETWFHFTVRPRYYAAVDTIRELQQSNGERHVGRSGYAGAPNGIARSFTERSLNPLGKLPGSVWSIPSQPLTVPAHLGVDHFAAFPMEWPRRLIQGWSPSGICTRCGDGRRPVSTSIAMSSQGTTLRRPRGSVALYGGIVRVDERHQRDVLTTLTGECCGCPDITAPTTPSVILDPFGGTGTTALMADVLGRHGVSVDMSHDYSRLARWRTTDPGERARAMQVDKPEPVPDGQLGLFEAVT